MKTIPWDIIALVLFGLAACALLAWFMFAVADASANAPTSLDRMQACLDAGGDWYWKNDWAGYVCEARQ